MAGSLQYIKKYGNVSFNDMPFGEADNVAFCEISYMPFEKIVSDSFTDEPRAFDEVCRAMFSYNGNRHRSLGLMINKSVSVKMMAMAEQKRFSEMKIVACTEVFKTNPAVQFGAATYILPDGTLVVTFRGTDDSIAGWKEDCDLFLKGAIPSHALAVEYLENVAKHFDGEIIIAGHSKGGNVALYAALCCREETRNRIKGLFNNDGPGFYDNSLLRTKAYSDLLSRYNHFVPSASFIGMMLAFDKDFTTVKSKRLLGPFQHDLSTWVIDGTDLKATKLSKLAKINEVFLSGLFYRVTREQSDNFDRIADAVIGGVGQLNLTSFAKHLPSSVKGAADAWKEIDSDAKDELKETFSGTKEILKGSVKLVLNENNEEAREEAVEVLEKQRVVLSAGRI